MRARRTISTLLGVVAAASLVAGCGDPQGEDDSPDAKPRDPERATATEETTPSATRDEPDGEREFEIEVDGGEVKGGLRALRVKRGDAVKVTIRSDERDEVHLHGIDLEAPVGPGRPAELEFVAKDQGSYELELHESHVVLGAVVVS